MAEAEDQRWTEPLFYTLLCTFLQFCIYCVHSIGGICMSHAACALYTHITPMCHIWPLLAQGKDLPIPVRSPRKKGSCVCVNPLASVHLVSSTDSEGKPRYFLSQSVTFGACSSVYAFNRIGAALRFLIQHVLKGVLTVFYDGFPFLETSACSQLMGTMTPEEACDEGRQGYSISADLQFWGLSLFWLRCGLAKSLCPANLEDLRG